MSLQSFPSLNIPNGSTQKKTSTPAAKSGVGSDGLSGVYWIGANGNIYTQDNNGKVRDMGRGIGAAQNGFDAQFGSSEAFRQIDDPNPGSGGGGGQGPAAPAGGGGGGGVSYPDLSGAIKILRENISALDPIYAASVANAEKAYETATNERISKFNSTKADSDASELGNDQTVLTSRNAIGKNTRVSADSIASILGSLGMSGSTTNKALTTIADKSNDDSNTANYAYGKNKQGILQAWNDYVNQDENQQKQLVDQKTYGVAQAGIARDTAKKDYLTQIASNEVNGGIGDGTSVLGEIAGLNKNIGDLSTIKNTYTGVTPTYKAPDIGTILGPNLPSYSVAAPEGPAGNPLAPRIVKVNPQNGDDPTKEKTKYGITT